MTVDGVTPIGRFHNTSARGGSIENVSVSLRRRLTIDEQPDTQHLTQYTQYGKTPNVIKRIRSARADIGDMGRELFMNDNDINRLPYLLDARIDEVYERFNNFLYNFNIDDYNGILNNDGSGDDDDDDDYYEILDYKNKLINNGIGISEGGGMNIGGGGMNMGSGGMNMDSEGGGIRGGVGVGNENRIDIEKTRVGTVKQLLLTYYNIKMYIYIDINFNNQQYKNDYRYIKYKILI